MEQVYLEDPSVLQQHQQSLHHQNPHIPQQHQHHLHQQELVDPTLSSVHLDEEVAHDVYTIEHDSLSGMGHQGGHESVNDLELQAHAQGGQDAIEHLGHDHGQHHHLGLDPNQVALGGDIMQEVGQSGYEEDHPLAGLGEIEKPRISHNRNPVGKNQYGSPDISTVDVDALREILRQYFNVECITEWKVVLSRLENEHGIKIKRATLGRYLRQFNIGGSRRMNYSKDTATPIILDHIRENDPMCRDSPTKVMKDLGKQGIHVKRDLIRAIMQEHFPDGFIQRRRNSKFKKKQEDGEPVDADGEDGSVPFGSVHHHALHHVHASTSQSASHHQQHHHMDMHGQDQHGSASTSRKLEEAQAEAARAIIMNMALQAQMASVNYRQHPGQTPQNHSQQQDHHHQLHHSSHHTQADVGEGSSTGMHTATSSAAAAAAAAGLMQSLTTGENADDPSIRALREEAMRQVAQMEGYRTDYVVDADEDETFEQDEVGLSLEQDGAGSMTDHVGRSGGGIADGEDLQATDYGQAGQEGYDVGDYTDGTIGQMKVVGPDDEENVDPALDKQEVHNQ